MSHELDVKAEDCQLWEKHPYKATAHGEWLIEDTILESYGPDRLASRGTRAIVGGEPKRKMTALVV